MQIVSSMLATHLDLQACVLLLSCSGVQVRSVPIRKDDEVQVVRGTFKVRLIQPASSDSSNSSKPAAAAAVAAAWRVVSLQLDRPPCRL